MSGFLAALPLVMVMVAGPQIVSAVLLATSERAKAASTAFLVGVGLATTLAVLGWDALVSSLDLRSSGGEDDPGPLDYLIPALLVVLAVRIYLRRGVSDPPAWMGRLHRANPAFALGLGFLLFLLMPTDLITTFTVGSALVREDADWWWGLVFAGLTVAVAGIPLWIVLVAGHRADVALPRIREWMTSHSWIISEVVTGFFLIVSLASLV